MCSLSVGSPEVRRHVNQRLDEVFNPARDADATIEHYKAPGGLKAQLTRTANA